VPCPRAGPVLDGRNRARTPLTELLGLGVAADMHPYDPMPVPHPKAPASLPPGLRLSPGAAGDTAYAEKLPRSLKEG
jgi:hypothetical protein